MATRPDTIVFHEHQSRTLEGPKPLFSERELDQLEKINRRRGCEIFKLKRKEIQATQYVGFLRVGKKTIQVVPKIFKNNIDADLHFLFYMLKYTKKLTLKDFSLTNLKKFRDNFFEVLIWLFAKNLNELLQYDMKKNYVHIEERTRFLKGKLLISEQIRHSHTRSDRLFCRYEEFTENNILNQTLKYVSQQLFKISQRAISRRLLEQVLFFLADVDDRTITISDTDKIHITRLNAEYEPIINLCKLFISNMSISFQVSRLETFAFMFGMNRLFEEFVYRFLRAHKDRLELKMVKGQKSLGRLFNEFNMYYDILVEDSYGKEILIDTKYKIPDQRKRHHGLSQSDFYQMFAYSQSQREKFENIVLLYPKSTVQNLDFYHTDSGSTSKLAVRSIDLERIWDPTTHKLNEDAFLDDLESVLNIN